MMERRLGVVKEIVEATGMGISYAYEDLVFLDHNAFLLQFTKAGNTVLLRTNSEADQESIRERVAELKQAAQEKEMLFVDSGEYTLSPGDKENITLTFIQ